MLISVEFLFVGVTVLLSYQNREATMAPNIVGEKVDQILTRQFFALSSTARRSDKFCPIWFWIGMRVLTLTLRGTHLSSFSLKGEKMKDFHASSARTLASVFKWPLALFSRSGSCSLQWVLEDFGPSQIICVTLASDPVTAQQLDEKGKSHSTFLGSQTGKKYWDTCSVHSKCTLSTLSCSRLLSLTFSFKIDLAIMSGWLFFPVKLTRALGPCSMFSGRCARQNQWKKMTIEIFKLALLL